MTPEEAARRWPALVELSEEDRAWLETRNAAIRTFCEQQGIPLLEPGVVSTSEGVDWDSVLLQWLSQMVGVPPDLLLTR